LEKILMSVEKREKFDKMLCQALKRHSEPVPADFTDRVLKQIDSAENRRILARVVIEERLTLAGCIILGIMTIVTVVVFPSIAVSFKELVWTSIDKVAQTAEAALRSPMDSLRRTPNGGYEWQLALPQVYMVFAGVFGFAVCSFVDLLVSDS